MGPYFHFYFLRYDESVQNPAKFWGAIVSQFKWQTPPTAENFLKYNFDVSKGPISVEWMRDGVTNVCYNCLDRHVENKMGDRVAFHWEGNDPNDEGKITYAQLHKDVCKFANVLKSKGVVKVRKIVVLHFIVCVTFAIFREIALPCTCQ